MVRGVVGSRVSLDFVPTDDPRSYHVSSARIRDELGFVAKYSIEEAARGLVEAFETRKLVDAMNNPRYYNIKMMQQVKLT